MRRRHLIGLIAAGLSLVGVWSTAAQIGATNASASGVTEQRLAQGPLQALPTGKAFLSIHDFTQVPGVTCKVCGVPGFVYALHGVATISVPGAAASSISPGHAAFTPAQAVHSNADPRVGAGAIAIGLIVLVVILSAATRLRGSHRRGVIAALSVCLIAGGASPLIGATSNEWYFFAVRPGAQLSLPMPQPDGRVVIASPLVDPVPAAPYIETLSSITVPAGARYDVPGLPGPEIVVVLQGSATVHIGAATQQLGAGGASFAQLGQALAILNSGSDTLKVLAYAVTSAGSAAT
ncbi:MAG TPA: hypothetical protein VLU92_09440 [Candidatus Dormibacteraeota bacterium]|nr:hypothetical protein [Candidatus Dormibacteraeota bacterium]